MKGVTMRKKIVLSLFIVWTLTSLAQQQGSERFIAVINRFVDAMKASDYTALVREYTKEMLNNTPLNKTTIFFKNIESQYGKVLKVDPPQIIATDQAKWVMYFERGTQDWTISIDDQGKIKWFLFTMHEPQSTPEPTPTTTPQPITESKPVPTQTTIKTTNPQPIVETKPAQAPTTSPTPMQSVAPIVPDKQQTELYPPFRGVWTVITGGGIREGAAQRNLLQQQYAYEFSGTDSNGLRYKNYGKTNGDYNGYGKEVLAPANGTIVEVIDGIRENSPGVRNPYAPIGNAIIIQHSALEYSVLAFLKQGSIRLKVGDKVTRGQVIAQCGNSGNAMEPAIHYHLQDSPYLQTARGVKFYFDNVMVTKEGKKEFKLLHLPETGDVINPE